MTNLEQRLATVIEDRMWQPIETAPKDGSQFLAAHAGFLYDPEGPDEDWVPARTLLVEWRVHAFRSVETGNIYSFTHWMPQPEFPYDRTRKAISPRHRGSR